MAKVEILNGDCREVLRTLPDQSINTCITSPPYFGLRDYKTATWQGGDPDCDHVEHVNAHGGERADRDQTSQIFQYKGKCEKCGATSEDHQIGLEKTPHDYIEELVDVFREVKRVLRDDGTLWVNIGDSYSSFKDQGARIQTLSGKSRDEPHSGKAANRDGKVLASVGLKNKDLIGIPWRLAFALQADGWYLRQDIIWEKPNPMPESVKDRCTKAHEYIFLLSKKPNYYFDNDAIKEPATSPNTGKSWKERKEEGEPNRHGLDGAAAVGAGGFKTGETRNKRSVWTVTTKPFKEAHFATFPPDLIEPCILAGCPEDGTVLDPFGGAGTTGLVAKNHRRNAVLIELNPEYVKIAENRIMPHNHLFDYS